MSAVASLLAMDRTTLTANLKPLERRGLVAVEAHPKDRRRRLLRLLEPGRELLAQAAPIWESEHGKVDALIQAVEGKALRMALAEIG